MNINDISKKYNILVAGWIGSENAGDEAIFASLLQSLKNIPVEITAFSINEEETQKTHNVNTAPFEIFKDPLRFMAAVKRSDLIIVGGGGILQDETSIFNTPRYLYKALLGSIFRKKILYYAVGVGPLNYSITKVLIKLTLNRAHAITVRDKKSQDLLIKIGVNPLLIKVSFDPAISLNAVSVTEAVKAELGLKKDRKVIGVCLRHWFDTNPLIPVSLAQKFGYRQKEGNKKYEMFIEKIANALNHIRKDSEYTILFIPFWHSRDTKVHQDVINKLVNKESAINLPRSYPPSELLGIFGLVDYVLAMRLHASIFSATMDKPFISLSYTSKVSNFLQELGIKNNQLDINTFSAEELVTLFSETVKNEEQIVNKLTESKPRVREKESLNLITIKEVLNIQ